MKYSKRRNQSYKMPEMDKDYVLNNLDLAVKLLDEHGLSLTEDELNTKPIPEITDRNHCMNWKPDLSAAEKEDPYEDHPWVDYDSF